MPTKHVGKEELVYIAPSLPTDPTDPGDAAYNQLAYCKQTELAGSSSQISGSDKDSGSFGEQFQGERTADVNLSWNRDFEGDAAQQDLEDAYLADDDAGSLVWILILTSIDGEEGRWAVGRVLETNLTSPHDNMAEGTARIGLQSKWTRFAYSEA